MAVTRIKICGLTTLEDALLACSAGADAIGLVFYPKSKRYVTIQQASDISAGLPPFVQKVGLFVNAEQDLVEQHLAQIELDLLQFHGEEDALYCESFAKPYIKAIRMKPGIDIQAEMHQHPRAKGFLLDSYTPGVPGGTGEVFNWDEFPVSKQQSLILAGGLNAENVQDAIKTCKPYAVDVSGGVERQPGIKSADKIHAFIRQIKMIEVTR